MRGFASAVMAMLALLLAATPAQARWLKVETPKFIVYSDGDESSARSYVTRLEVFDAVLRSLHGLNANEAPPRKLPLYLLRTRDDMQHISPGLGDLVAGLYAPSVDDIFAMGEHVVQQRVGSHERSAESAAAGNEDYIFHEYTHHFMLQYFPYGYPGWLVEGYAEYFATVEIHGDDAFVGKYSPGRTGELLNEPWVPVRDLLGKAQFEIPPSKQTIYYGEAWLLTHYLMSTPQRKKQMQEYVLAVGKGEDQVKAMERVTGQSAEQLEVTLQAYLRSGLKYLSLSRKGAPPPVITVTVMPEWADAMLLDAQGVRTGIDKSRQPDYLRRAQADAQRYPDVGEAQIMLARAQSWSDKKAGLATVSAWTAGHPDDIEALVLAATLRMDIADEYKDPDARRALYKETQPILGHAFKLDPNRYQTLMAYTRSRRVLEAGDYPADNTLEALLATLELAPQVDETRMEAAQGMMRRKRWKEARQIITPLANNPHHKEAAAAARKLLQRIDEQEAAG